MGLSARALLDLSQSEFKKPDFSSFWDVRRKKVTHPVRDVFDSHRSLSDSLVQCAEKILGVGQPQENFNLMSPKLWRAKLEREMSGSGLPDAIQKLTREMVDQAKQRALMQECEAVCKQLRKMSAAQEYVWLYHNLRSLTILQPKTPRSQTWGAFSI